MHLKACHTADLYVVTHGQDIRLYLAIPGSVPAVALGRHGPAPH
jgi:hypothetical protein